jgi:hypothetical protein
MLSIGCSDSNPAGPSVNVNPSDAVALAGGSTLAFQDSGFLDAHRDAIERITKEAVIQVRALIPIDGVTISARAGTANVIPETCRVHRRDLVPVEAVKKGRSHEELVLEIHAWLKVVGGAREVKALNIVHAYLSNGV